MTRLILAVSLVAAFVPALAGAESPESAVAARMKKYVPVPMEFDARDFNDREKALLRKLLEIGRITDEVFWRQAWHGNPDLRARIVRERGEDDPVRQFFFMQAGPYDRLDHDAPFLDVPPKPKGAGFYPPDMTKEEFEKWLKEHPGDREAFLSPYTVIERRDGRLVAIPYHEAYREEVEAMAALLSEAADLADNASFARYLRSKAKAILTDEYFQADVDWIDVSGSRFDMVFGPFEVYEDHLNNLKAGYEASVEVVDLEESARLDVYTQHLPALEANLPYPDAYKNRAPELTAAFAIVRDVYRGGHMRVGYQPVAANLPNDPRVHEAKGSKKTFWKNIMDARLGYIILPIGRRLIAEEQVADMTGQGYFDFVLMHEIAHGIGPRFVHGTKTPVNVALRELYSWIEENKADMAGLHSLKYFREQGIISPDMARQHFVSYLGSIFRTIRFGTGEAHGRAAIVSLNFLMEHGGITHDAATGRYAVDFGKIDAAIERLTSELLLIEAEGDYERAKRLSERYGATPGFVQKSLEGLADLPIDIVPQYSIRWE